MVEPSSTSSLIFRSPEVLVVPAVTPLLVTTPPLTGLRPLATLVVESSVGPLPPEITTVHVKRLQEFPRNVEPREFEDLVTGLREPSNPYLKGHPSYTHGSSSSRWVCLLITRHVLTDSYTQTTLYMFTGVFLSFGLFGSIKNWLLDILGITT